MTGETRVALTPQACHELVQAGHEVYAQSTAGESSGYSDDQYQQEGVTVVSDAATVYAIAELIVKVKQPLSEDLVHLHRDHLLFSYLHLAADPSLVKTLCDIGLTAIPFESVKDDSGHLPLLRPMSQIAGRIAVVRGASLLFNNRGGRGVLLGGAEGSDAGNVVVLGAGVAGSHAVEVAVAMGANVHVVDINADQLAALRREHPGISTHYSDNEIITGLCADADLVIGAVLLAGKRAPIVLKESVVKNMLPGSVIVDIAIDQGGCVEGIRVTDTTELCYLRHGVLHSAVPNMPAATPRTSSQSLSSSILPYVQLLADNGLQEPSLKAAVAISDSEIRDEVLKQALPG